MTDQHLVDRLERSAERVPVGQAPVPAMLLEASRAQRRRRATAVLATATAVVAVTVMSAVVSSPGGEPQPRPPATLSAPSAPPAGMRFVGVGHAAIAVPEGWGSNQTRCGTPQRDTVVVDRTVIESCATARPDRVDSVELSAAGRRFDFTADMEITVDGVAAERQATTCQVGVGSQDLCNGTVFIPSLNVSFRAESSTGATEVDRILEQVRVLPDLTAVPGTETANQSQRGTRTSTYVAMLDVAGLAADVQRRVRTRFPTGYVVEVTPPVGTMVAPGTTVVITVAR